MNPNKTARPYHPQPGMVELKQSDIHGFGIFAKFNLQAGEWVGASHHQIKEDGRIIRTPFGGYINHSDDPNCIKQMTSEYGVITYYVVTLREIEAGEELTLKYTLSVV